ncbi:four helix bundle protein [Solitalea sp. MAHUQ-68]|uniref:Four helix bundle protein n=1 Tax=Solitalea agri TaxID=2953739 RepID=A0A9X2JDV0_9SPHI|nr:four helix bundle protein [Solitalea agri]MCO4291746.1 four helix bundle protein [Solitalea agri]
MTSFEDLEAWKFAREFRKEISELTKLFPSEEKYRLTDQILRSSRSISNNIAEGFGRFHFQENIQFCRQARGSLTETNDHLYIAFDEKYISKEQLDLLLEKSTVCLKVLNGYIAYLKNAKEKTKSI